MSGYRWRMKSDQFTDQQHDRAEMFAMRIMLPEQPFIEAYEKLGGNVFKLAAMFEVPVQKIHRRIEMLSEQD